MWLQAFLSSVFVLLTWLYVRRANTEFDRLNEVLIDEKRLLEVRHEYGKFNHSPQPSLWQVSRY